MNPPRFIGLALAAAGVASALAAQQPTAPSPATNPPAKESPEVSVSIPAMAGQRKSIPIPEAQEDGVHLSLKDAITIALANNVDLNVAVAGVEVGRGGLLQSKGIFDPLLGLNGQWANQNTPQAQIFQGNETKTWNANLSISQEVPIGGLFTLGFNNSRVSTNSQFVSVNPAYSTNGFLLYTQPLLRNFGIATTTRLIHISENTLGSDSQSFVQSVEATVNSVEQAYWDLVFNRKNLEVAQFDKDLAVELNRITQIKIDVGSQAPIDIVQTESGVALREVDIIRARGLIGQSEDQLKRLLNFGSLARWNDHVIPTDDVRVETAAVDLDAGVAEAMERRPEIRAAMYAAASARINYEYSRNQLLPQLDFLANYGYAGLGGNVIERDANGNIIGIIPGGYGDAWTQLTRGNFRNWTLGLTFSFPILNRNARGAKAQAEWNLEASLASLEQLRQDLTVQIRTAARTIDTSREAIIAAGKARELAERNLDAEHKKYDNGLVTSLDVLQVQDQLILALSNELQALTVYRKAVASYHLALGDMLEWKNITVEGLQQPPLPSSQSLTVGN
jgi:HAE1 family hydrophobic/amphiphilic exporter-1